MVDELLPVCLEPFEGRLRGRTLDHIMIGRSQDKIYLFGFSRGAYAARTLAGMIERVSGRPSFQDIQYKT